MEDIPGTAGVPPAFFLLKRRAGETPAVPGIKALSRL